MQNLLAGLAVAAKVRNLEPKRASLLAESEGLHPIPRLLEAVVTSRLDDYRRLLRQSVTQGRALLQRVLRGCITFTSRE